MYLSKALEASSIVTITSLFELLKYDITSCTTKVQDVVELFFLKPNCISDVNKLDRYLFKTTTSKSLNITLLRVIAKG